MLRARDKRLLADVELETAPSTGNRNPLPWEEISRKVERSFP